METRSQTSDNGDITDTGKSACPVENSTAELTHNSEKELRNALGKIAESYDELHNISVIQQAKNYYQLPLGSYNSTIKAIFQSAEVALQNLIRLTRLASCKIAQDDINSAMKYVKWSRGFHQLLESLGSAAFNIQTFFPAQCVQRTARLSIKDSPTLKEYVCVVSEFESIFEAKFLSKTEKNNLLNTIGLTSHEDVVYSIVHSLRILVHDAVKWESDLTDVMVEPGLPPYNDLVATELLKTAIDTANLEAETYYPMFVALHQIPEILSAEVNDHTERSILYVRSEELSLAQEQLSMSVKLMEPLVKAQTVMVDCLATGEYHYLRENLGPASGMHSLAIRQHMFRDLFCSFWKELELWITKGGGSLESKLNEVCLARHSDSSNGESYALINTAIQLHQSFQKWRHEHLNMPRNCLGSGGTKSMIGIPDGLDMVKKMRDASNTFPSLKLFYEAMNLKLTSQEQDALLTAHHLDDMSLDSKLIELTGHVTREVFPEVQKKDVCPFRSSHPVRKP
ncbi:hypothetical protein [Shewanella woodyi]|uniref:hypothetical protein n=1 Tax=Shewanella woodyi TaxID=60961 RepID=UPI0037494C93